MSSLIGHSVIASALFARTHKIDSFRAGLLCVFVAGLAMSPDVDYLIHWFWGYRIEPRYTHSLIFCLLAGLIAWGMKVSFCAKLLGTLSNAVLFLAPLSHLMLDLLVAVYPMPLFWPLSSRLIVLPFGVLPSAGGLQLTNYYLWRNLLIEMGILLPIVILLVPRFRKTVLLDSWYRQLAVFCLFLSSVLMGISLNR